MKERGFISIFKGSAVEADQVHEYFQQNRIGSLVRNHMQENLAAGWMILDADRAAEVFVSQEDFSEANGLLNKLYRSKVVPVKDKKPTKEGER